MSQPALPQRVPHEVLGPFLIGTWLSTAEPALPHRVLHEVLGTFLIGTWLSTTVFAFEIIQVYRYFKLYPISWRRTEGRTPSRTNGRRRESPRISIMVLWMLAMNVITAVTPCVCAYTWLVTGWGSVAALKRNILLLTVNGIATDMCIFTMHLFLLSRFYTLSRRPVASATLASMAIMTWALFITISVLTGTAYRERENRKKMKTVVAAWLISSVVTDWLIVGSLMWTLSKIRTTIDDTKGMIARIIRLSVISGSIPTIIAVISLIAFMSSPDTNYSLVVTQCLGSVCTITVLYNLTSRDTYATSRRNATEANSSMHFSDTTTEPGQLFGTNRAPRGNGAQLGSVEPNFNHDPDSKPGVLVG